MSHRPANSPCECGEAGWMPGVEHIPVKWAQPTWITERAGKMQPIAVVDHIMQGFLRTMVDWASNGESKVIVHFGIDRSGRIVQFQPVHTPGRHVSSISNPVSKLVQARGQDPGTTGANAYTIGIEHEGCSVPLSANDSATIRNVTWSRNNPWPEPMVAASIRVKEWCFANVPSLGQPSRDTIIGHYEIDARNRPDDPADSRDRSPWPVDRMMSFAIHRVTEEEQQGEATTDTGPALVQGETNAYIVQRGDTLGAIARRFSTTVDAIATRNGIENPNQIEVGQVLRLTDAAPEPQSVVKLIVAHREGYARAMRDAAAFVTESNGQPISVSLEQIAEVLMQRAENPPGPA